MSDWHYNFPISAEIYTLLIAHLNSACNPILYATYNSHFRHGYFNVIRCLLRIKKPEYVGQTTISHVATINYNRKKSSNTNEMK